MVKIQDFIPAIGWVFYQRRAWRDGIPKEYGEHTTIGLSLIIIDVLIVIVGYLLVKKVMGVF